MYTIKRVKEVVVEKITEEQVNLSEFLGFKFKEQRIKLNLKMEDVVNLSNGRFSASHLSRIENGNPSLRLKDMETICEVLKIDIGTLFSEIAPETKAEETL